MKSLLLFLAVVLPMTMDAQQGKYARYIKKFDVVQFLPEETDKDPAVFWRAVVNNNKTLKEGMEKFTEPKGSAKKALEAEGG